MYLIYVLALLGMIEILLMVFDEVVYNIYYRILISLGVLFCSLAGIYIKSRILTKEKVDVPFDDRIDLNE